MGIPSFYKHLLQTVSGLTTRDRSNNPELFALDLNCAIYHCVRNKVSIPYTADSHAVWEKALILEVLDYIKYMVRRVNPTACVYIAVDGVAPMAKIKQQRARRFKSAQTAAEEAEIRRQHTEGPQEPPANRWDTNAITPGTAFMAALATALKGLKIAGCSVVVSAADEAGEGEQKIMAYMRAHPTIRDAVVYGLDADLIVLALLESARSSRTVDLFREETEFGGGVKSDGTGEEMFLYLQTSLLADALWSAWRAPADRDKAAFLTDFVGLMSLLGNDFVPHGMALKINDEGIEHVLEALKTKRGPLVLATPTRTSYNLPVLLALFESLAQQEERWMLRGIRRKLDARVGASSQAKDNVARALAALNDRPVVWAAEKCLVEQRRVAGEEKPKWFFRTGWRQTYSEAALWSADVSRVVAAYCATLTWTLQYYMGEPVDLAWYFPWLLPPLLGDIVGELRKNPMILEAPALSNIPPLDPCEQLAMVLPTTSFHLLPAAYQHLPTSRPHAWPTGWGFFSMSRRFLWECEPLIPLVRPEQIRAWL
jgi:5'-3' exonuclease